MATYQILYWHDIPAQVRAKDAGGRASVQLPPRFQKAIDQAAMAAGVTGSDAYSEGFRWRAAEQREGSAADVARDIAAALDTEYSTIDWRGTVAAIRTAASAGTPAPTES